MNPKPRLWWLCGSRITSTCASSSSSSVSLSPRLSPPVTSRRVVNGEECPRMENPTTQITRRRVLVVALARRVRVALAYLDHRSKLREKVSHHACVARVTAHRASSSVSPSRVPRASPRADTAVVAPRARAPSIVFWRTFVHGAIESTDEYFRPRRGVARAHGVPHGRRRRRCEARSRARARSRRGVEGLLDRS